MHCLPACRLRNRVYVSGGFLGLLRGEEVEKQFVFESPLRLVAALVEPMPKVTPGAGLPASRKMTAKAAHLALRRLDLPGAHGNPHQDIPERKAREVGTPYCRKAAVHFGRSPEANL